MVKKIGDIILLVSLAGTVFISTQECVVSLSATDRNGQNITEVQVGIPFYLTVSVAGKSRSLPAPTLTGIDRSYIKGESRSQDISMVNGNLSATMRYNYTVVLDAQGSYTFGPAQCTHQGSEIVSNTVSITAGHKTTVEVDKQKTAFATLFFGKKEAFYQEPVECFLRFYYSVDGIRLQEISEPKFKGCVAEPLSKPRSGVENIDGVQYRYLEWKTTLYPNTVGEITLVPVAMRYLEPQKRRSMMGGGSLFTDLFDMMGGFEEQHELYSNSAQLSVLPLPEHAPAVHAVGDFTEVRAHVNNTNVNVGEGIVISLEVIGEGNLFALTHPTLDVSANCTFYEGNVTYQAEKKPQHKIFEYVLQAHAAGTYILPPQTFTYFDLATQSYKNLVTNPITLTVTGTVSHRSEEQNTESSIKQEVSDSNNSQLSLLQQGSFRAVSRSVIPWSSYFLLVLFAPIFLIGMIVFRIYKKNYDKRAAIARYQDAFKNARKELEMARKKKYHGYVYSIFIHMLAERLKIDVRRLTEDLIEERIAPYISGAQLVQWRFFYVMMSEAAFANTSEESDSIFTQGFQWLNLFERIV